MKSRNRLSLIFIVGCALIGVLSTLFAGWKPGLGLDLQGGASVILKPVGEVREGALEQARSIIDQRVNGLGVGEPDVRTEGDRILVEVPGVKDPQKVLDLVGQTAELRFRPVLSQLGPQVTPEATPSSTIKGAKPGASTTVKGKTVVVSNPSTTVKSTAVKSVATSAVPTTGAATTIAFSTEGLEGGGRFGLLAAAETVVSTTAKPGTTKPGTTKPGTTKPGTTKPGTTKPGTTIVSATTKPASTIEGATTVPGSTVAGATPAPTTTPEPFEFPPMDAVTGLTGRADDKADANVVLADADGERYLLGPTMLTGEIVDTAIAEIDPGSGAWKVRLDFTSSGSGLWDGMAAQMINRRLAIVLDSKVVSAPNIATDRFGGTAEISGDFTVEEAKELATVLRYGSLPVQLEQQTVQTVSASLGRDSLRAGLLTGLLGLLLVALYMLFYYRSLAVVMIAGVVVSASLLWTLLAILTRTSGLALSLSGVVGVIVSVGVTVDSYVVYFERLRDEIRAGRSVQSSIDRGFRRAWRTILAADGVSILGALVLYLLTAGSVRGFALMLMLSTALDMIVAWFFTRPLVASLAGSTFFTSGPWGVAPGAVVAPIVAGAENVVIRPGSAGTSRGGSK